VKIRTPNIESAFEKNKVLFVYVWLNLVLLPNVFQNRFFFICRLCLVGP